jgi:hypothetical protein
MSDPWNTVRVRIEPLVPPARTLTAGLSAPRHARAEGSCVNAPDRENQLLHISEVSTHE